MKLFTYDQPNNLLDGMKYKYIFAEQFQRESPNTLYIYMDVDVLTYKNISELIPNHHNILYIHSEEKLVHFAGFIQSSNYLAGRLSLTDSQKESLQTMGGISAGFFAWHHESNTFSDFFKSICSQIQNDRQTYYTIEQPYFNEAVVQYSFGKNNIYTMDSDKIGFNHLISKTIRHPFVVINYAGEPGNETLHSNNLYKHIV